ncbi:hypothetical protein C2G38_2217295 [Gigaspora rosea]|uniref:Uncharacterized protein n=1 Tax=Gigaspora rosea TaxID=44941 RepID=A0A397U878_9GLOM|nr:hypothetical protein C2G38_2217295 [Gigaspora rosea]
MQVSISYILKNVDINQIEETWAIRTITASNSVILLSFFPIRLIPKAVFHITHIHKRWYNDINDDLQEEPIMLLHDLVKAILNTNLQSKQAVQFRRYNVPKKLQDLLTKIQEDMVANDSNNDDEETCSNSNNEDMEDDKENVPLAKVFLQNPKGVNQKGSPRILNESSNQKN